MSYVAKYRFIDTTGRTVFAGQPVDGKPAYLEVLEKKGVIVKRSAKTAKPAENKAANTAGVETKPATRATRSKA